MYAPHLGQYGICMRIFFGASSTDKSLFGKYVMLASSQAEHITDITFLAGSLKHSDHRPCITGCASMVGALAITSYIKHPLTVSVASGLQSYSGHFCKSFQEAHSRLSV
jgi:hypothetical protein